MAQVTCSQCKKGFEIKISLKTVKEGVEEVSFHCPKCRKKYIAFYTNDEVKMLQKEIRDIRLAQSEIGVTSDTEGLSEKEQFKQALELEHEMNRIQNILKYVMRELEEGMMVND